MKVLHDLLLILTLNSLGEVGANLQEDLAILDCEEVLQLSRPAIHAQRENGGYERVGSVRLAHYIKWVGLFPLHDQLMDQGLDILHGQQWRVLEHNGHLGCQEAVEDVLEL